MTKYKIYTIDYLQNGEFSDEDLHYLCDGPSFKYSLICAMFEIAGYNYKDRDLIENICKKDPKWMYKFFWTKDQCERFTEYLIKSYMNLFMYSRERATNFAYNWLIQYSLTNILCNKKNKRIYTLED